MLEYTSVGFGERKKNGEGWVGWLEVEGVGMGIDGSIVMSEEEKVAPAHIVLTVRRRANAEALSTRSYAEEGHWSAG